MTLRERHGSETGGHKSRFTPQCDALAKSEFNYSCCSWKTRISRGVCSAINGSNAVLLFREQLKATSTIGKIAF